jgi:hypothetical protein
MKKPHLVLILTEPTQGLEEEYNDYYENLHLREVLQVTDLKTAQRFKLAAQAGGDCPLPYLAVYQSVAGLSLCLVDGSVFGLESCGYFDCSCFS